MKRNLPCDMGRQLGANLARLTEPEIAEMVAHGIPDERCSTCAFRAGSLPNGCLMTVADAMKCTLEGSPKFLCHDSRRIDQPCHGWLAARIALDGKTTEVPWKFSDEYTAEDDTEADQQGAK